MNSEDQPTKNQQENTLLSNETIDSIRENKNQFMSLLVHNLKNPVGSALSFSDMILEDIDSYSPEKLKKHLNIIKSSCEAALNQLDILLIETRIEIKNLDLHLQKTLFSDLIKNGLSENEKNFQKNNLTILVTFFDNESKINLDRSFIKHTLSGLFQFLLLHSRNDTIINIDLKPDNNLLLMRIEGSQCAKCDEKIKDFNFENSIENNTVFNLKQEKHLSFKAISTIAQKHDGYFTLAKNKSNSLVLTLAISTKL